MAKGEIRKFKYTAFNSDIHSFLFQAKQKNKKKTSNFDWIANDIRAEKIISAPIWAY